MQIIKFPVKSDWIPALISAVAVNRRTKSERILHVMKNVPVLISPVQIPQGFYAVPVSVSASL